MRQIRRNSEQKNARIVDTITSVLTVVHDNDFSTGAWLSCDFDSVGANIAF